MNEAAAQEIMSRCRTIIIEPKAGDVLLVTVENGSELELEWALKAFKAALPDGVEVVAGDHRVGAIILRTDDCPCPADAVYWNPGNRVTQCHRCGKVHPSRSDGPRKPRMTGREVTLTEGSKGDES